MKLIHTAQGDRDESVTRFGEISPFWQKVKNIWQLFEGLGSGCCSVGKAVAFETRGPQFDSSHWQNFIEPIYYQLY